MKKYAMMIVMMLAVSGCATRTVKLLDASWVSMKNNMPPSPKENLVRVSNVSEEFCMDSWSGSYGLMDEVVKKVEAKNQIDYIKYPSFTQSLGRSCVQVSGEGYRVAR